MSSEEQTTARIHDIQRQLLEEFEGKVDPEVVEESLRQSLDAYAGVRIRDFVPLFVYRETRVRLIQSHAGG